MKHKYNTQPISAPDGHFRSVQEAATAITALSSTDRVKLMLIARSFWRQRIQGMSAWQEPEDLLQEAIVRTLKGSRRWRGSVSIVRHLDRAMESISSHAAEALQSEQGRWDEASVEEVDPGNRSDVGKGPVGSSVHDQASAREEIQQIEAMFATDSEALRVLRCRVEGYSPSETCATLGIDQKSYETLQKRIWRAFVRHNRNS